MKIGVLGAGQLARMLALAGLPHGHQFRLFDPDPSPCGADAARAQRGDYASAPDLQRFAEGLDVVTCEFENVPVTALHALAKTVPVFPSPRAFETAQDRLTEKTFLNGLGIETAPFASVDSLPDLEAAAKALGLPAVLKTRRLGYDGRGQVVLTAPADLAPALQALGGRGLILEGFVTFTRELSLIAVRGRDGDQRFYPLCDNTHTNGILTLTRAPAAVPAAVVRAAEAAAAKVLAALDYTGVLVLEFFLAADAPRLIVNELAPRVHNSGHWTIEGAATSQFENHVRAVTGLPLGATAARGHAAMINLIGHLPDLAALLRRDGVHAHFYGKTVKPGRKVGHVTLVAPDAPQLAALLSTTQAICAPVFAQKS